MKKIKLSKGKVALIDDEDFEYLSKYKWYANEDNKTGKYYAKRAIYINGKQVKIPMQRVILNAPFNMEIDHINGNTLDNRRTNLRICTHAQNCKNCIRKKGVSKYRGVYWYKNTKRWKSQISIDNKRISLGYYKNEIDAAIAYNLAAMKYHREFAVLNNIKMESK